MLLQIKMQIFDYFTLVKMSTCNHSIQYFILGESCLCLDCYKVSIILMRPILCFYRTLSSFYSSMENIFMCCFQVKVSFHYRNEFFDQRGFSLNSHAFVRDLCFIVDSQPVSFLLQFCMYTISLSNNIIPFPTNKISC